MRPVVVVLLVAAVALGIASALVGAWWTAVAMVLLIAGQVLTLRNRRRREGKRHQPDEP